MSATSIRPSTTPQSFTPPSIPSPGTTNQATQETGPETSSSTSPSTSSSSSSSSTSASSSSSSSSPSSSSTSSSSSSTTASVSTTPSTSKPSTTSSSSNTNIPAVVTEVSTTFVSESQSSIPTAAASNNSTGNAFFQNKAAVAGVFSVVGFIGLVILIALVINAIRRRQARNFEKEVSSFAATARVPDPDFLDPDLGSEDDLKRPGAGYSDGSHGTYGQPPMEAITMRDMGGVSTAVGEIYPPRRDGDAGSGGIGPYGVAGIGVARSRSGNTGYNPANANYNPFAAGLQEGGSPYPQFVLGPQDTYGSTGPGGPFGRGNMELGATMIPSGQPQPYSQRSPPLQEYTNLGRSKSDSTDANHFTTPSQSPLTPDSQPQPSYSVKQMSTSRSPPPTRANPYSPHPEELPTHNVGHSGGSSDAYGGYVDDDDEVDEQVPRRVLKIANES